MSISKVAGIALASVGAAGFAGCASSSQFYDVNNKSKAMIEQSVPNGANVSDSLSRIYSRGEKLGEPTGAVRLRDFAVNAVKNAETKSKLDSVNALWKDQLDSTNFSWAAKMASQESANVAEQSIIKDSIDSYWVDNIIKQNSYWKSRVDSTKAVDSQTCEIKLDSAKVVADKNLVAAKKKVVAVGKYWQKELKKGKAVSDSLQKVLVVKTDSLEVSKNDVKVLHGLVKRLFKARGK